MVGLELNRISEEAGKKDYGANEVWITQGQIASICGVNIPEVTRLVKQFLEQQIGYCKESELTRAVGTFRSLAKIIDSDGAKLPAIKASWLNNFLETSGLRAKVNLSNAQLLGLERYFQTAANIVEPKENQLPKQGTKDEKPKTSAAPVAKVVKKERPKSVVNRADYKINPVLKALKEEKNQLDINTKEDDEKIHFWTAVDFYFWRVAKKENFDLEGAGLTERIFVLREGMAPNETHLRKISATFIKVAQDYILGIIKDKDGAETANIVEEVKPAVRYFVGSDDMAVLAVSGSLANRAWQILTGKEYTATSPCPVR